MAKRAGGSRARKTSSQTAARPTGGRPTRETAREKTLAGDAANELAGGAKAEDAGDIAEVVEGHVAAPEREPGQAERDRHAEDAKACLALAVHMLRHFIVSNDEDERPFVRVIGRIIHILTVVGGRKSCTVMPITVALLLLLRDHLDPEHRQPGTDRQAIDVTEPNLQGLLYDRLKKLTSAKWMQMLERLSHGKGYQLTESGRFAFESWPEEIDFDPNNPDLWTRKARPKTGGR